MNPEIRNLESRDIDRVYDLGMKVMEFSANDKSNHRFWPKETLERFAAQGFSFVVDDRDSVVGFLLAVYQPVTGKLTWENMYLSPEYRKQGLSEKCFEKSWERAQRNGAIVAEGIVELANFSSRKMLERLGFQCTGSYNWMLKFGEESLK
jgi:GNAT superfamily N-acetyltransferase